MIEKLNLGKDYRKKISNSLENCLTATKLKSANSYIGKVRDTYDFEDKLVIITTDRQSAFDRILATIPFKGQVLNETGKWWFEQTKEIIPNHSINYPDPNVTVAKKCTPFPIEFVVRGYITGSSSTSLWTVYEKGEREYCGNKLPNGLSKNQQLPEPIITPTTKEEKHDRPISPNEIIKDGWMTKKQWEYCSKKALELFSFGQKKAADKGLVLVDTKYEMGISNEGNVTLIDEIHTPDSSRYWIKNTLNERITLNKEPVNIDKEFLRLWFKNNCDPYNDDKLPNAPEDLVVELSSRYILLYEMITGENFQFPDNSISLEERILTNLQYLYV